jgi:hypothetical protein
MEGVDMTDSNRRRASYRRLGDGRIGIWLAFEDKDEAKALPGSRWDKHLRCWTVPDLFERDARELVDRLNLRYAGTGTSVVLLSSALTSLFAALPAPYRTPTHRALARVLHPDHGGTNELMRALNDAWDAA